MVETLSVENARLRKPAVALLVGAALLTLINIIVFLAVVVRPSVVEQYGVSGQTAATRGILLIILGVFAIVGAISMLKRLNYGVSMAGAICGIIEGIAAVGVGWILLLPFAIWALVVLAGADGKRAFLRSSSSQTGQLTG